MYALLGLAISVGMGFCVDRIAALLIALQNALWGTGKER